MYAEAQTSRTLRAIKLVGVTAGEVPREIKLNATYLRNSLSVWAEGDKLRRDKIPAAAKSFLIEYNHEHAKHPGKTPRLKCLRVYEYVWKITDRRPGEGEPDEKRLIYELKTVPGAATRNASPRFKRKVAAAAKAAAAATRKATTQPSQQKDSDVAH